MDLQLLCWPGISQIASLRLAKLVASDINFGKMNIYPQLGVSLDVFADRGIIFIRIAEVNMALEADAIDSTVTIFKILD